MGRFPLPAAPGHRSIRRADQLVIVPRMASSRSVQRRFRIIPCFPPPLGPFGVLFGRSGLRGPESHRIGTLP
jgi:hypothetical protein